jgi:cell filamentation protein, protein adenylyltransferase
MHFSPDKPFNQLPDLPPKVELETPRVLKATTRAGQALAELKARTHTIPNPDDLAQYPRSLGSETELRNREHLYN